MKSLSVYIQESEKSPNAFVILKPGFISHFDEWKNIIEENGWEILKKKTTKLSLDDAQKLYKMHKDKDFYKDLCEYMSSDKCICMICYKDVKDPIDNMSNLKDKVRNKWGKSEMKNAMHSSDSLSNVMREKNIIFN